MDPRTLLILQKMLQRQLLKEIHGCISTGKEANVYHAITESGDHRAIKGKKFRNFRNFILPGVARNMALISSL